LNGNTSTLSSASYSNGTGTGMQIDLDDAKITFKESGTTLIEFDGKENSNPYLII
jgi:hypothetical protein